MNNGLLKRKIVNAVLKQLPEQLRIPEDEAMISWWLNIRKEGGLRLSDVGDQIFRTVGIEYFEFSLDPDTHESWVHVMIDLNNKLIAPYHIALVSKKLPTIRIYDSKIAMMIGLYGNIFEYLKSIKNTH
jgi:hypothetical protein